MDTSNFSDDKLITCILPKGLALSLLKKLKDEMGINRANINSGRGMGKITPLAYRGIGDQAEKEMLNIVVSPAQADELFNYIYEEADINRPHGGMIYMSQLTMSTPFTLPELPVEK